ncbi:hypothetical protein BPAE_0309g00060 [Botrytis paeoniae]|uniref:Uncharacterized protein n=1 Tax=Botrytis paeoniae TaxID=278948 RepID=A0A4Z1FAK7_9HELO|nr:hypothetical protein BPAE_0309g00060 [Botrytis paeoniae]
MADTIMQDTVMQDADMQDIDLQDTIMQDTTTQDTTTQDTTTQDTTTQDTVVPGPVRKIAKMKKFRKNGQETCDRKNLWRPTENFHLLHLYTINNNIFRAEDGTFDYGEGAVDSLIQDMTAESVKHHPGGLLHASDPWFRRTYTYCAIYQKLRRMLMEEDDLAVELEAELNAHYGIVPDAAAAQATIERQRRALEKELAKELKQREKDVLREKRIQDETRMLREKHIQDTNEALRVAFTKVKKPVIIDKTDT